MPYRIYSIVGYFSVLTDVILPHADLQTHHKLHSYNKNEY